MILPILHYPDSRLRTVAKEVKVVDKTIKTLVKNMFETMYAEGGIGLAATQVNQHLRVIVMDVPHEEKEYLELLDGRQNNRPPKVRLKYTKLCLINPVISHTDNEKTRGNEGCLSVPGYRSEVIRYKFITLNALNEHGKPFTLEASGLLAVCIQHEIDHLNGILFIDHLSKLKQSRLLERTRKIR